MYRLRVAHLTNVIDGRKQSGTARVARELIRELSQDSQIEQFLFHFDDSDDDVYKLDRVTEIRIPLIRFNIPAKRFFSFLIFVLSKRIHLASLSIDVVHWHVGRVYPLFWLLPSKAIFVTLHDAGGYLLRGVNNFWTFAFRLSMFFSRHKVDLFLAVSKTAMLQLKKHSRIVGDKIDFVYVATRIREVISKVPRATFDFDFTKDFILCVSRWQPHKNVVCLVQAYELLCKDYPFVPPLMLVGQPIGDYDEVNSLINKLPDPSKVVVIPYVDDAELRYLYETCLFSVFPSLHEGFGLAVLESMALEKTVLVHNQTATCEILGIDELCIDMNDPLILFCRMNHLLKHPEEIRAMNLKVYLSSKRFSWSLTAKKLVELYSMSLEGKG